MHYCSSVSFALYILINKIKQYFWLLFQYFLLKEYTVQLLSLYLVLRVQNCLSKAHSWLPRPALHLVCTGYDSALGCCLGQPALRTVLGDDLCQDARSRREEVYGDSWCHRCHVNRRRRLRAGHPGFCLGCHGLDAVLLHCQPLLLPRHRPLLPR